ncbi:MAG: ATP-binding protein [Bacteroidota bacterium]
MEENRILKVAILGAESTGKTTLCKDLANHFDTVWVPEYAREYLANLNRNYTLEDLMEISKQQLIYQRNALDKANKLLFVDTEMIILKVWCDDKFKTCPDFISNELKQQKFDIYLIMANDIAWEYDPLRENPDRRDYLFDIYIKELERINANYRIIGGLGEDRLNNAVKAIEENCF